MDYGSVWVLHRCVQRPAVYEVAMSAAKARAAGIGVCLRLDQQPRYLRVAASRRIEDWRAW